MVKRVGSAGAGVRGQSSTSASKKLKASFVAGLSGTNSALGASKSSLE